MPQAEVTSCTQSKVELSLQRAYCISRAANRLPLQLEDAGAAADDAEGSSVQGKFFIREVEAPLGWMPPSRIASAYAPSSNFLRK